MKQSDTQPVLVLEQVTKAFGSNVAVRDVSLRVEAGEIFGFLGPNGAGKSTTIRLILDVLRPTSGTISVFGRSNRETRQIHREIGYLSGDMVLDSDLTGRQYLDYISSINGGTFAPRIPKLAERLEAKLDTKIGNYSRGNRQKISLIAALLHQPRLLILDEPTSGFDPLVQETFAALIRDYRAEGGTVFMSSHVLTEVQELCDRAAFIKNGSIVAQKSINELLATTTRRIDIEASRDVLAAIRKSCTNLPGLTLATEQRSSLGLHYSGEPNALLAYLAGHKLDEVTIRKPDLDEIFGQYYETEQQS